MEELKPLNADIVSSIRAARQKLSVDLSSKENMQQESFMETGVNQLCRPGSNLIDRTMQSLKHKIELLEGEKQQLSNQLANCRKVQQHEVDALKQQLSKYIEREFEQSISVNSSSNQQLKQQLVTANERVSKKDLEVQHYLEKYREAQQHSAQLKDRCGKLQCEIEQLMKEKDKHIELNIEDKLRYEEELRQSHLETDRKQQIMKRLEQQALSLRKELHQMQAQQRCSKNVQPYEKKLKEDYEFELKELNQRYSVKLGKQQKELHMLRKTIEKFKNQHNQSDAIALANSQKDVEQLKEKIVQLETKLSMKQIDVERLTAKVEHLNKTVQQKEAELKKQEQTIQKKEDTERNLLTKLAKTGLEPKDAKQHRTKLKDCDFTAKFFSNVAVESDTPTFTQQKTESKAFKKAQQPEQQQQPVRTLPDRGYSSDFADNGSLKSDRVGRIAKEERALADLKSTFRKADCADMTLSQLMQQIRRKNQRINDLRQGGTQPK